MSRVKVNVRVTFKIIQGLHSYTGERKSYEVEPFKIVRSRVGSIGAARNRYYYVAHFIGFGDMISCASKKSVSGEDIYENINRKQNPKFKPKNLTWVGNVAIVND